MTKGARNRTKNPSPEKSSQKAATVPQKLPPEEAEILREVSETAPSFQKLPLNEQRALIHRISSVKMHSGPLPSPEDLREYGAIIPDGAERIMALTEKQALHRMEIEKTVMEIAPRETKRGQVFAFLIGLTGLMTAAFIAYLGMATAAATVATAALGTLAIGFLRIRSD